MGSNRRLEIPGLGGCEPSLECPVKMVSSPGEASEVFGSDYIDIDKSLPSLRTIPLANHNRNPKQVPIFQQSEPSHLTSQFTLIVSRQALNWAAVVSNANALIPVVERTNDGKPTTIENGDPQPQPCKSALVVTAAQKCSPVNRSISLEGAPLAVSSDLWSAAYREAVERLGEDLDVAILQGKNAAQLFKELEAIEKDATQESAFLRGVEYLRSIQVPLERFKLALDLASPLTSIEPATSTVFGVVRSVSAVSLCSQRPVPSGRQRESANSRQCRSRLVLQLLT
jgi:hypothetical protein